MMWQTWVWLGLLAAVLGFEGYAIVTKRRGDTLTENVRAGLKLAKKYKIDWLAHIVLIGTLGWMILHFTLKL